VLELLEPGQPFDRAPSAEFWPSYLRGLAHLQQKRGSEAAVGFQTIADHRGEAPDSVLYPLAHLGLARASSLTGDTERARAAYRQFLTMWKDADADLRPLQEARRELDALR
jgi:eukaryotic-like serine/threonine-protein kinase